MSKRRHRFDIKLKDVYEKSVGSEDNVQVFAKCYFYHDQRDHHLMAATSDIGHKLGVTKLGMDYEIEMSVDSKTNKRRLESFHPSKNQRVDHSKRTMTMEGMAKIIAYDYYKNSSMTDIDEQDCWELLDKIEDWEKKTGKSIHDMDPRKKK